MSASATGWRSKCPYNFGGDAEACDPCPQCDADKPQSPLAASNDAEVGYGVAELQRADWHIPGPCGPENWEQRAVRRVAEVKGDPPKPPLCWICGKPLPHDCVGVAHEQSCWHEAWNASAQALLQDNQASSAKHGSVKVTANGRDIIIIRPPHGLLVERADVPDLLVAVTEARGFKHGPPQSAQPILTNLPKSQQSQTANSFAPPASTSATARKWPIGIPANEQAVTQANLKIPVKDSYHWGERLIAARAHRGLTLNALGARLTPPRTRKDISAMEHGRRGLSVELCAELAQALDCDRCWLAGWKEES